MQKNNAKLTYLKNNKKKVVLIFFSISIKRNETRNYVNVFFSINWFFTTINHEDFRKLLLMIRSNLILIHRIKSQNIIFSNYENNCTQIKIDSKHIQYVFIALNKW